MSNVLNEMTVAAVTFLLATLLQPHDYGIMAMAYLYVVFIHMLIGFGFSTALVQRNDLRDDHLNSVFWLNLAAGMGFAAVAILLSGLWSRINRMPDLQPMVVALSVTIPIQSLTVVQVSLLQKRLDFKRLAIRTNVATAVGGATGVAMALLRFGAWALVAQQIALELAGLALLWGLSDWRPRFAFRWCAIRDLLGYALKTLLGQVGTFFQTQSDSLLIGLLLGPAALGLYRLADRLVEMNLKFLPRAMQVVSLPHFSRVQHDREQLNRSFLFNCHLSSITTFPAMAFVAGASSLILGCLGKQWTGATRVLEILTLVGIAKVILVFVGPLLQAVSRPGIHALNVWTLVAANSLAVFAGVSLLSGSTKGQQLVLVAGIRTAIFLGVFAPMLLWQANRASGLSAKVVLAALSPAVTTALAVFASVRGLQWLGLWSDLHHKYSALFGSVAVAGLIWLLCVRLLDRQAFGYVAATFSAARRAVRGRLHCRRREKRKPKELRTLGDSATWRV